MQPEPMARHTSWRVGGMARGFCAPRDLAELQAFLRALPADEALFWVGLGSNLLVRDGGLDAVVISPVPGLAEVSFLGDGRVRAEAGVTSPRLARLCADQGLAGLAFLAGVPGSLGGALCMNAGAHGADTWSRVESVTMINRAGELIERPAAAFEVGYRSVRGPVADEWFVAAVLRLEVGDPEQIRGEIRALLERRNQTQPTGTLNCGSVFRNPAGDSAGRLIEACGLKGERIGGAVVSTKHANFIINDGAARAADIEALIERVRDRVEAQTGVRLQPEVKIVGRAGE